MTDFKPNLILYTADSLNDRGEAVLANYPDAETLQVTQHNRLPELGVNHFKVKSGVLVLGKLKSKEVKWSGRSSGYIAPSLANGCFVLRRPAQKSEPDHAFYQRGGHHSDGRYPRAFAAVAQAR